MLTLPRIAFAALLVIVVAVIIGTAGALPDRVASHFGAGGLANGWMSRNGYVAFMVGFTVAVPLIVVTMTGLLPGMARTSRNIPHHDYWFAPSRRAASAARLVSHACLLGVLMVVFFGGLHMLVLLANADQPARLNEPVFFSMLAVFLVGIAVWIVTMRRLFPKP
ncbi:MAG: DUF1648 domain-containing protein [Betaproteobacteria bacterium]